MTLTGWIIYNGSLYNEKFIDYANMLETSGRKQGHDIIQIRNDELISLLTKQDFKVKKKREISTPDYILFTDKDIYLAYQLEAIGFKLFNSAKSIELSDDKIRSYQVLSEKKLPIPKTFIAPKFFKNTIELSNNFIDSVKKELEFPFIIKEAFGSFGEQVYLVHNQADIDDTLKKINNRPYLCQAFIESSYGVDLRLQVIGDKVVTAMKRTSTNDFRANITSGGSMQSYQPDDFEKNLAIEATKALGLDFAGVDLLFGPNDTRIICEVNSNAHIRNLYDCTGINVADLMLDYVKAMIIDE